MQLPRRGARQRRLEGNPRHFDLVDRNDERVFTGGRQRQVEHQHGGGFEIDDAGGWLVDLHHAGLLQGDLTGRIEQPDPQLMAAEFSAAAAQVKDQVRARMHRGELLHGDVAPDAQHRQLPMLIEQCVIAEQREIDSRIQFTRIERITSPCCIALTRSMPLVT